MKEHAKLLNQVEAIGRDGKMRASFASISILVVGQAITVIDGHLTLASTA